MAGSKVRLQVILICRHPTPQWCVSTEGCNVASPHVRVSKLPASALARKLDIEALLSQLAALSALQDGFGHACMTSSVSTAAREVEARAGVFLAALSKCLFRLLTGNGSCNGCAPSPETRRSLLRLSAMPTCLMRIGAWLASSAVQGGFCSLMLLSTQPLFQHSRRLTLLEDEMLSCVDASDGVKQPPRHRLPGRLA